jgi:hypothetical protein
MIKIKLYTTFANACSKAMAVPRYLALMPTHGLSAMRAHCVGCRTSPSISCDGVTKRRLLIAFQYLLYAGNHSFARFDCICKEDGTHNSYRTHTKGSKVRVPVGSIIFSSLNHPDQLRGPPNLLSNGYRGRFPRG